MAVINNFDQIGKLLKFPKDNEDIFYHLQIIRRGKDHPELAAANRTIMTYYLTRETSLDYYRDEIIKLCEIFGARAYINLNPKSMYQVALNTISQMATRIAMKDLNKIYKTWNSVTGALKPPRNLAKWIIDVDNPSELDKNVEEEMVDIWLQTLKKHHHNLNFIQLENGMPVNEITKEDVAAHIDQFIHAKIPTKHGYHLITSPFDLQEFQKRFDNKIDVHKNNPTILYIPEI